MVKKIKVLEFFYKSEENNLSIDHLALREHLYLSPCNTSNWIKRLLDQKLIEYQDKRLCTYVLTEKGRNKYKWKNKGAITKNHLVVKQGAKTLNENTNEPEKDIFDDICDFLFED